MQIMKTATLVVLCLSASLASAQQTESGSPSVALPGPAKLRLPEGTEVQLVFVDPLSSATNAEGDRFTLRVDSDVKINDRVVIPSGAIAVGTVTHARKKGYMGKAGELNVNLDHVTVGDDHIALRANKSSEGQSKIGTTVALTVLFGPVGLLKRGHDIDIKPGTPITGFVDQTTYIPSPP
jgi:hypothetical protein